MNVKTLIQQRAYGCSLGRFKAGLKPMQALDPVCLVSAQQFSEETGTVRNQQLITISLSSFTTVGLEPPNHGGQST